MTWRLTGWSSWREVWSAGCLSAWRELYATDPDANPFQHPDVVRAWAETAGAAAGAEPRVLLATHASGARVLLPAVVAPHRGRLVTRRILEAAGQSLFGYAGPLVANGANGTPLATADWTVFWERVRRETSADCDQALLRAIAPGRAAGRFCEPASDASPVLELSALSDMDELLARCAAKHRGDVRRQLRRLEEQGTVELWTAGEADATAALEDFHARFVPAYQALWGEKSDGGLLVRPGILPFLARLLGEGLAGGFVHYAALRLSGEPIAWHLGLRQEGELHWWFPTYALAWQRFSPGKVLLAELLDHGLRTGLRRVHFLTGDQDYKLRWRPESRRLAVLRWPAPTLRGRLLALYDRRAAHPRAAAGA
ncbi:MAG TPA: GNAT family N-acetyltransferase [Thermoanaerobaculia bacterium]